MIGEAADVPMTSTEPTDPLADGADADHPDDDGEETFKSAAYFPSLMIHRRLEELDGVQHWIRCEGRDHGHQIDSRVHYFDREIGFLQAEADQEMIERNKATAAAFARRRQQVEKRKAHHKTVDRWSMFERWVLDRMPAEQYAPRRMTGTSGAPLVGSMMTLLVMLGLPCFVVSSKPSILMA